MKKKPFDHLVNAKLSFEDWLFEIDKIRKELKNSVRGKPHRGQKSHKGVDVNPAIMSRRKNNAA